MKLEADRAVRQVQPEVGPGCLPRFDLNQGPLKPAGIEPYLDEESGAGPQGAARPEHGVKVMLRNSLAAYIFPAIVAGTALLLSPGAIADPGHGSSNDRGTGGGYGRMSGPGHMMDRRGSGPRARDKGPMKGQYRNDDRGYRMGGGHHRMMGQGYGHHRMMGDGWGQRRMGRGYGGHMGRRWGRSGMDRSRMGRRWGHSEMGGSRMGRSRMGRRWGQVLSVDDVRKIVEGRLAWRGNPNIKLGKVEKVKDGVIAFEIVTKDGSLVRRWLMDPKTGRRRPADREPVATEPKPAPVETTPKK